MSKFISGQNLLTRLDIPPFELLRYVKKGLQPIDRYSKPILPPAISSKLDRLKFDCKQLKMDIRMLSEKRFQTEDEKRWLQMKLKRFENDKKELEQLEGKYSWEDYELPEEVKFAERVIDSLLNAYYNMEEVEAIEKATLELPINSEIESVSDQKEKIAPLENISEYLSKAGKKGGEKPKKNQPILLAIIKYLQDHPKLEGKTNFQIGESFKRNVCKEAPIIVNFDGCEWDVYFADKYIEAIADATNKKKHKDKLISYATFRNSYISEAKKIIKNTQDT